MSDERVTALAGTARITWYPACESIPLRRAHHHHRRRHGSTGGLWLTANFRSAGARAAAEPAGFRA
jgi:hypothetical protein